MSIADNLKAVTKKAADAKKALQKELQASFNDAAQAFFNKAPEGTTITWCQYTPYFNDGDPCVFGVGGIEVRFKPLEGEDKEMAEEEYGEDEGFCHGEIDQTKELPKEVRADAKALTGFISSQEELMLALYDDHNIIRLSKDGATVSDYEHD